MTVTSDPLSDEVFTKAATQTIARTRGGGGYVQVTVGGREYSVAIHSEHRAFITYRRVHGELESTHIVATPEQDLAIRTQMRRSA